LFFLFTLQLFFFALTYPERPRVGPKDVLASYPHSFADVVLNPICSRVWYRDGEDK
jgi:hypothetical protein